MAEQTPVPDAVDPLNDILQHLQNSGYSVAAGWQDKAFAGLAKKKAAAAIRRLLVEARIQENKRFKNFYALNNNDDAKVDIRIAKLEGGLTDKGERDGL